MNEVVGGDVGKVQGYYLSISVHEGTNVIQQVQYIGIKARQSKKVSVKD